MRRRRAVRSLGLAWRWVARLPLWLLHLLLHGRWGLLDRRGWLHRRRLHGRRLLLLLRLLHLLAWDLTLQNRRAVPRRARYGQLALEILIPQLVHHNTPAWIESNANRVRTR